MAAEAVVNGAFQTTKEPVVRKEDLVGYYDIALGFLLRSPPDRIEFGPTYRIRTSWGYPVSFDTYLIACQGCTLLIILGYNEDDTPVAYMRTGYEHNSRDITSEGYVITTVRGVGIGSSAELVQEDILQRIANDEGVKIIHEVFNGNRKQLIHAESCWQSIFGSSAD